MSFLTEPPLKNTYALLSVLALTICSLILTRNAQSDPCGMVPPVQASADNPIKRVGAQKTYVFYRDNVESFVVRPGFSGKVSEFGMLIPFPEAPSIRKVPNKIFSHVAAAIDPPEVIAPYRNYEWKEETEGFALSESAGGSFGRGGNKIKVLNKEAVGMYQVAVLEAGSPEALKNWMDEHGYKYPNGMDAAVQDYVDQNWAFVAVKARVGVKEKADPKPGQRSVKPDKPDESTFDGNVQAMGFRFKTDRLVVPMRLSAFNKGKLHNITYVLTDGPKRIRNIPKKHVRRQVSGETLYDNITTKLPLRIVGTTKKKMKEDDNWKQRLRNIKNRYEPRRDPERVNGHALDLFASDLLAVKNDRLIHPFEEKKKELLDIGEHLGLRGKELDRLHRKALEKARKKAKEAALEMLKNMTMTVVDGDFPREVLKRENLTLSTYEMPAGRNSAEQYDAREKGPDKNNRGGRNSFMIREVKDEFGFNGGFNPDREQATRAPESPETKNVGRTSRVTVLLVGLAFVGVLLLIPLLLRRASYRETG